MCRWSPAGNTKHSMSTSSVAPAKFVVPSNAQAFRPGGTVSSAGAQPAPYPRRPGPTCVDTLPGHGSVPNSWLCGRFNVSPELCLWIWIVLGATGLAFSCRERPTWTKHGAQPPSASGAGEQTPPGLDGTRIIVVPSIVCNMRIMRSSSPFPLVTAAGADPESGPSAQRPGER